MMSRTKLFYLDLLNMSTNLLFLDPDHARSFVPTLDGWVWLLLNSDNESTTTEEGNSSTTVEGGTKEEERTRRKRKKMEDALLTLFLELLTGPE